MEEFKFNAAKYFNSTRPDDFRSKDAEIKKALSSNFKLLNDQEFTSLYNKLAEANMTIENRNGGFKFENLLRPEDLLKVNNNKKGNYKNGNVSRKNWRFTYHGQDMSLATNYAHVEFENSVDVDQEKLYSCSTCKKKYRWKSTLRRHEMVECGGKEPSFQCPQCPYKAKQRGNLGVHMRKYHSSM